MQHRIAFSDIMEKIPIVLLLGFTGLATWDIVNAISPTLLWPFVRPLIAVILFDGGFLYWEWRSNDRANTTGQLWIARMMQAATLIFIVSAGIGDALYRQTFSESITISQEFTRYMILAPLILTGIFLVGHTIYTWLDPATQAKLARRAANEQIEQATIEHQRKAAARLAPQAGKALARARLEEDIRQSTGREIHSLIPDWLANAFDSDPKTPGVQFTPFTPDDNGRKESHPKVDHQSRQQK